MIRFLVIVYFLTCCAVPTYAQMGLTFDHYKVDDGLSQSTILDITQDKTGFIWLATRDGLNRFDGTNYKTFYAEKGKSTGLPSNFIKTVFKDSQGRLWVGSSSGLRLFDPISEKFKTVNTWFKSAMSFPDSIAVWRIFEHPKNRIWILTLHHGLLVINTETRQLQKLNVGNSKLNDNWIRAIAIQKNSDAVYIATPSRIYPVTLQKNGIFTIETPFPQYFINQKDDLGIQDIILPEDNRLWVGKHTDGIRILDTRSRKIISEISKPPAVSFSKGIFPVRTFYQDKENNLYIGTYGIGLLRYSFHNKKWNSYHHVPFYPSSLGSDFIRSVFVDKQHRLWIGHEDEGISVFDPNARKFNTYTAVQLHNEQLSNVKAIYAENDTIFLGKSIGQLCRFIPATENFKTIGFPKTSSSHQPDQISHILPYDANNLWIGTYGSGLFILNKKNLSIKPVQMRNPVTNITRLAEADASALWICSNTGLFRYDPETGNIENFCKENKALEPLKDSYIKTVFQDGPYLWIATDSKGVWKFDLHKRTLIIILPYAVNAFLKMKKILWMATYEDGLVKINEDDIVIKSYSIKNGLPGNLVFQLFKDPKGWIWMSTNKGLARLNPAKEIIKTYDENDGIQGLEYYIGSGSQEKSKKIWFGGKNGIDGIDPYHFRVSYFQPKTILTGIEVNEKPFISDSSFVYKKQLELAYEQNFLKIDFTAINFIKPVKNRYRYQLEGVDEDWINTSNAASARYTGLKPGSYIFRVKAGNNDGIWNTSPTLLRIIIHKPFWQTWWFISITSMAIIACLYLGYRYRLNQIRKLYAVRNRISRDLHDDIGATLSSINILTDVVKRKIMQNEADQSLRILDKINSHATETVDRMSDIIWSINPNHDQFAQLIERIRYQFLPLCHARNILLVVNTNDELKTLRTGMDKRRQLYLSVKEALHNAIKHSEGNEITIHAVLLKQTLSLSVTDNGKGIDPNKEHQGNGLKNIRERIKDIGGTVEIQSDVIGGTSVLMTCTITRFGD